MINENNSVVKKNLLVEAIYDFSTIELKLTLIAISKIINDNDEFMVTKISVNEFTQLTKTRKDRFYNYIKNICNNLGSRTLKIYDNKKNRYIVYPWFSKLEYFINEGIVEIKFNDEIKPFLLMIKDNFTAYSLKYVIHMKGKHSIRLYELLKQYENIGNRKFELEKFKQLLNINNKYKFYANIKDRILEPTRKEIEKCSDIKFKYKEIKEGKKIVGLNFSIINIKKAENYEKYDKFKLINKIEELFYEKFGFNIDLKYLSKKHRLIILPILKEFKDKNISKIIYPERWFIKYIKDIERRYDPIMLEQIKDF